MMFYEIYNTWESKVKLPIKWMFQRIFRGYDDRLFFNNYLSYIIPMIIAGIDNKLSDNTDGVSYAMLRELYGKCEEDYTEEQADIALKTLHYRLKLIKHGLTIFLEIDRRDAMLSMGDEKNKKYLTSIREIFPKFDTKFYDEAEIDKAFDLLKKYKWELWD